MYTAPAGLDRFLRERGLLGEIYDAMKSDDYSDVVMAAYKILNNNLPQMKSEKKSEVKSNEYRNKGNEEFKAGNGKKAVELYNRALMYAPNKSRSMLLAYSNRSAVLYKNEYYIECLVDIDTCFRLGCPPDIVEKLNNRKQLASQYITSAKVIIDNLLGVCSKFFHIENRNAEVPCASADVDIVVTDGVPKITAANDIKIGTVLAVETSFVACNDDTNIVHACHYCHNMSFNLIPCDGCCFVLFCGERCKQTCMREYHSIECRIMEFSKASIYSPMGKLTFRGALKFVGLCDTWEEVIEEAQCIGKKRRLRSTATEMFDVGNKLSILNYEEDHVFVYGSMFVSCFTCASVIHTLEGLPSYFPRPVRERALAKRALARILMYLTLFAVPTEVTLTLWNKKVDLTLTQSIPNHGWYPFIGKLRNSCTPNALIMHLNNRAVLMALQPIKKGSELTVSHMGHYLDKPLTPYQKNYLSFRLFGRVCGCYICSGEWKTKTKDCVLTETQLADYKEYILKYDKGLCLMTMSTAFPKLCEAMTSLNDVPFSMEYIKLYTEFRKYIMSVEQCVTANLVFGAPT